MADNVTLDPGTGGATLAADDVASVYYQRVKINYGDDGSATDVSDTNPLPVDDAGGALTVDHATLDNAHSADFDSGAGTDTTPAFGIAVPASGGAAVIPGDATAGLKVDLGADNDVTVTGTVTVDNAGTFAVQVDGSALTALQLIDDIVYTDDTSTHATGTSKGALIMAAATPTDSAVDANDIGAVAMSTDRRLLVDAQIVGTDAALDVSGATVTVTGTVTANLGAIDNAVLDSIDAAVNGTLTVGSHAVTNAGTFAVQESGAALTALQLIDDPIATISATPLMRVAIFDSSDSQITTFGGGTQYAVDTALGATPTGTLALGIRDDALSALTPVEGDAVGLRVDANGALWTIPSGTVTVDNGGTFAVQVDAALPAGTNAIGKLAANSGVDIGDVDVTSVVPGTGASNLGKAEDAAHTTGDVGVMALSVRQNTATALSGANGDYQPLITDTNGRLHVKLLANEAVNVGQMNGVTVTMGNGVSGTGVQRVTLASDSTGQVALAAGTASIGKLAANSGVDIGDVDVTSISAGSNLIGDVGLSGARTSGGTTLHRNIDVDETEDAVKATAGQLFWIHAMNMTAAVLYLHFYNATVASVTVGTTTPDLTFALPTQGDTNGAGFTLAVPNGIAFGTAITIACTTTIGGSSGPAANGCVVNLGYA